MGTVCVIGSLNIDLVTTVARHPGPSETVHGNDRRQLPSGKGANQARAGATAMPCGRIAADATRHRLLATITDI